MSRAYHTSSIDWKPSAIVALATSADDSRVAAAREDGSLEIWLVSPGSVGWHHQLTIHGDPASRVSSLVWCRTGSKCLPYGRLFSSSIDGSVSEWDLFDLKHKIVLESIGVSIWQMALEPLKHQFLPEKKTHHLLGNGYLDDRPNGSDGHENSDSEDTESEVDQESVIADRRVALACDDGAVRIYSINDSFELIYYKSLPRVSGRILSVTWSHDACRLYSGGGDGLIRCWDANMFHELYRSTVGLGGPGSGPELCVWSLLSLRCGTVVSADSNGSVQFWDGNSGTLLQAHSNHKGDANALAAAPSHNRVFSAGADGQVILYKLSNEAVGSSDEKSPPEMFRKWVYVNHVRAHTHDVKALTVAVPISQEASALDGKERNVLNEKGEKAKRTRCKAKPIDFSYHKWAHLGVPMLISAGDDSKLFAYSVKEFTKFSPHDVCPAPQSPPIQLVNNAQSKKTDLLLVQTNYWLDILCTRIPDVGSSTYGSHIATDWVARVKSKSRKIICSAMSNSGQLFAYSDNTRLSLFKLRKKSGKTIWTVKKKKLPQNLPSAHSMVFSSDSSRLMIAGHDRRIYSVDVHSSKLLETFVPCCAEQDEEESPHEPPITKMFTSSDGQWLAAINCFGDVYIFNLEIQRQHWFISRLDGACVTAGGFPPFNNNVLIITTSSNQVYVFDVEAKQLGEWSSQNSFSLPKRYQEFPGEVIGLSFSSPCSSSKSSPVIIYSARAMCSIDFGKPVDQRVESSDLLANGGQVSSANGKRKRTSSGDCQVEGKHVSKKNFDFVVFRDPVLFIGHLSKQSILIIDKPWMEVVKTLEAKPLHRHIFGS